MSDDFLPDNFMDLTRLEEGTPNRATIGVRRAREETPGRVQRIAPVAGGLLLDLPRANMPFPQIGNDVVLNQFLENNEPPPRANVLPFPLIGDDAVLNQFLENNDPPQYVGPVGTPRPVGSRLILRKSSRAKSNLERIIVNTERQRDQQGRLTDQYRSAIISGMDEENTRIFLLAFSQQQKLAGIRNNGKHAVFVLKRPEGSGLVTVVYDSNDCHGWKGKYFEEFNEKLNPGIVIERPLCGRDKSLDEECSVGICFLCSLMCYTLWEKKYKVNLDFKGFNHYLIKNDIVDIFHEYLRLK